MECLAKSNYLYQRRQWHPTPVLLPGKSHGRRSLVGCSPWSRWGSDTTEQLHFHFSLSCIGEGNGNPLQCSCLENPRDGGAWWAAVYGVAQSQSRLKWLSSSSSKFLIYSYILSVWHLFVVYLVYIFYVSMACPFRVFKLVIWWRWFLNFNVWFINLLFWLVLFVFCLINLSQVQVHEDIWLFILPRRFYHLYL